jgi:sensor histidine kinase YesM
MSQKTIYYWSIQLNVWFFFSGVFAVSYWYGGNQLELEIWQLVVDFSVIALLSILFTHSLKVFLNKFIEFDNLKLIDGFKVLGLLTVATTAFFLSYLLYDKLMYTYIYDRADALNHASQTFKNSVLLYINYTLYFLVWTVFYVAIKGLMELNKGRESRLTLESNLKESRLNTLKGQINPHFMFNSLNNIRGLMLEDVAKSRDMLTRLSETLRYSLTKNDVDAIALEDELEMVHNYVEISKIQLEDRLEFVSEVDDNTLNKQIPPMIIQMLVENAIKHGISNLKSGGKVILTTRIEHDKLLIDVTSSGALIQSKDTTQLGLENIKQRLQLLYGEEAIFSLFEHNNQVVASIKIPLIR